MTGQNPYVELKPPADCSKDEHDRFRDMVLEAGEVEDEGLDARIARARVLAFLRFGTATIGVGALKVPNQNYVRKLFKLAHTKCERQLYELELGWVVVELAHRGNFFSRRIVEALVARAGGQRIYATSVSTRIPMHRALIECDFAREGGDWQSKRRPDERLFLFVHNSHTVRSSMGGATCPP